MKSGSATRQKHAPTFSELYSDALTDYLLHPEEAALRQAYELGRDCTARGISLVEIAIGHQESYLHFLRKKRGRGNIDRLDSLAAEFLAEVLSPYEMANRGFRDAVSALRKMNEMLEEEIKRIAYAVHDEAGQLLVAVHLALSNLARHSSAEHKAEFENVNMLLKQVEAQLRQYSHELRPTILDDLGLIPAIRFLAGAVSKRAALPIQISADVADRLPPAAEIALYRILQEALNNVVKHARASSASIELFQEPNFFVCKVQDDGIGFNPDHAQEAGQRRGLGLTSMKERINAIGGTLVLESSSGRGTCLTLHVPRNSMEVKHAHSHSSRG
ncbi:MAG TPA: ATP-binding protein [Candidatus Dormibacteraeota bacterium]|jgi:two-component system sensor histidine kinase UhpB|nr:ATP-binding protein [Candidatus Dormibacteraeota bacterium]